MFPNLIETEKKRQELKKRQQELLLQLSEIKNGCENRLIIFRCFAKLSQGNIICNNKNNKTNYWMRFSHFRQKSPRNLNLKFSGYSEEERMTKLQKCLKGEDRTAVAVMMLLAEIKISPSQKDKNMEKIIYFSSEIKKSLYRICWNWNGDCMLPIERVKLFRKISPKRVNAFSRWPALMKKFVLTVLISIKHQGLCDEAFTINILRNNVNYLGLTGC